MPCAAGYEPCSRKRCSIHCTGCQYYIPSRGSRAYHCDMPPEFSCPYPDQDCKDVDCPYYVPDRRKKNLLGTANSRYRAKHKDKEKERKRRWIQANREKHNEYTRNYKRKKQ